MATRQMATGDANQKAPRLFNVRVCIVHVVYKFNHLCRWMFISSAIHSIPSPHTMRFPIPPVGLLMSTAMHIYQANLTQLIDSSRFQVRTRAANSRRSIMHG
jgi:hypothetical protein